MLWFRSHFFPKYSWTTDYKRKSDQPYDMSFFYKMIKERDAETTLLYNSAYWQLDTSARNKNLIVIGGILDADSTGVDYLLNFIDKGNRALIAVDDAPMELLTRFVPRGDSIQEFGTHPYNGANIRFTDEIKGHQNDLWFNFQKEMDTSASYSWGGYLKKYFEDTLTYYGFVSLATINDTLVTAFYADYGRGRIIFHSNPITFSNYHMARRRGFVQASNIVGMLHPGDTYWYDPSGNTSSYSESASKNPLKFLFSHSHLRWAWYLFLVTVILYVVFRTRREQRVIGIMPANPNTTLDYAKTVGLLYFKKGGQRQIVAEMYTVFLADLRSRYNIPTDMPQKELVTIVVSHSGVPEERVKELFREFSYLLKAELATGKDIMRLHKVIEQFNKQKK